MVEMCDRGIRKKPSFPRQKLGFVFNWGLYVMGWAGQRVHFARLFMP
jgi:hypothetical protein